MNGGIKEVITEAITSLNTDLVGMQIVPFLRKQRMIKLNITSKQSILRLRKGNEKNDVWGESCWWRIKTFLNGRAREKYFRSDVKKLRHRKVDKKKKLEAKIWNKNVPSWDKEILAHKKISTLVPLHDITTSWKKHTQKRRQKMLK